MTAKMPTNLDLGPIRWRLGVADGPRRWTSSDAMDAVNSLAFMDAPALVDEVERLRDGVSALAGTMNEDDDWRETRAALYRLLQGGPS